MYYRSHEHLGTWGGYRWSRFTSEHANFLKEELYNYAFERRGMVSLGAIREALNAITSRRKWPTVSRQWIQRIFKSWGWSWKHGSIVQWRKFLASNIEYYHQYLDWTLTVDPHRLIFLDEASFDSRSKVLAPKGSFTLPPPQLSHSFNLQQLHYLLFPHSFCSHSLNASADESCLIGVTPTVVSHASLTESIAVIGMICAAPGRAHLVYEARDGTNTQWTWARFLIEVVNANILCC